MDEFEYKWSRSRSLHSIRSNPDTTSQNGGKNSDLKATSSLTGIDYKCNDTEPGHVTIPRTYSARSNRKSSYEKREQKRYSSLKKLKKLVHGSQANSNKAECCSSPKTTKRMLKKSISMPNGDQSLVCRKPIESFKFLIFECLTSD